MATVMPTRDQILNAAHRIREGKLVAFPTETVYGLGADATNGIAVAEVFAAKGRPQFNPLIVHVASLRQAREFAEFSSPALRLAEAFWPGPLSLVLPLKREHNIAPLATAGLNTIAVRQPDHPVAQELITACDRPLAAPSANLSGHVSATTAEHVAKDFQNIEFTILDGGPTRIGLESTIVHCHDDRAVILRTGAITAGALERHVTLTEPSPVQDPQKPSSPGQLASHYAPSVPVRLDARQVDKNEALLAFGPDPLPGAGRTINLSERGNLKEAAARLFGALRDLDCNKFRAIAVMPVPNMDLGIAINDRLRRAAVPRGQI